MIQTIASMRRTPSCIRETLLISHSRVPMDTDARRKHPDCSVDSCKQYVALQFLLHAYKIIANNKSGK